MPEIPGRFRRSYAVQAVILFGLLFFTTTAHAQYFDDGEEKRYAVGITAGYDVPLGNLKWTYKAAPIYGVTGYIFNGHTMAEVGVAFREFQPKANEFYYRVGDNDYGVATFSSFKSTIIYMGGAYGFGLSDMLELYGGFNLAYYSTKYVATEKDAKQDYIETVNELEGGISPKIGIRLSLSDNLGLNVQGLYNIFGPLGKAKYNSRVGTFYTSATGGISLMYKF